MTLGLKKTFTKGYANPTPMVSMKISQGATVRELTQTLIEASPCQIRVNCGYLSGFKESQFSILTNVKLFSSITVPNLFFTSSKMVLPVFSEPEYTKM